jgi:hypothetical protein
LIALRKEAGRDGAYRVAKRMQAVVLNSEGRSSGELQSESQNHYQVLHLSGKNIRATADSLRARCEFLDAHAAKGQPTQGVAKQ